MNRNAFVAVVLGLCLVSLPVSAQTGKSKTLLMDDDDQKPVVRAKSTVATAASKPVGNARFSVVSDFSSTLNPNGAWSYGYTTTLGKAFALYTVSGKTF
jgi:hypothetical protein